MTTDADDYLYPDDGPSAFAALAPSKGGCRPAKPQQPRTKTHAELQAFYEAAPKSKYCFLHGYSGHLGKHCHMMLTKKATFTTAQLALTKPKYVNGKVQEVDGRLPNETFHAGFRHED